MVKVSRSLKEIASKIREIKQNEPDAEYSVETLAGMLGVEKETIVEAMDATSMVESLDKKMGEEEDSKTFVECIASARDDYAELVDQMALKSVLNVLDEREKKVILYRYFKEMTQSKVAEVYGTSQVQVSRIEKKALEKMKVALGR